MSGIISDNKSRSSGLVKAGAGGVPTIAGDKSPATAGDIWYNSSTTELRCRLPIAAWSAGGNLGTARQSCQGFGTSGAAAVAGGNHPAIGTTEEYNGTTWGAGGDTNTDSHGSAQGGLLTAGIKATGYGSDFTTGAETYDGTSWTAITAIPAYKYESAGLGIQTAFGVVGGDNSGPTDTMDIWNGSSWSAGGTLDTTAHHPVGCGTTTAGLKVGGLNPSSTNIDIVEEYNGTDWTTVTAHPLTVSHSGIAGIQTDSLVVAGKTNNAGSTHTDAVYSYDGTNWTSQTAYPIEAFLPGMSKNDQTASSDTIMFGGNENGKLNLTYEWLDAVSNATITTS